VDNGNGEEVECEADLYGGGWIKVFDHVDSNTQHGDMTANLPNLPFWYSLEDTGCN
jgi:hypothetical protein